MNNNHPSEDAKYHHWLNTGEYPDGIKTVLLTIGIVEREGVLDDTTDWFLYGSTDLTPTNGKRVRKAADAAHHAFLETIQNTIS